MTGRKGVGVGARGEEIRVRVLDAAERLLRQGRAEFSMRDLASDAGVSFATPFNRFGSKAAVMHALSARRIEAMEARLSEASPGGTAVERVSAAVGLAVEVMLEEPAVSRGVMSWIGTAGQAPGEAMARSAALWRLALGAGEGLDATRREEALRCLPELLAFGFRGVLSFWTAGELGDEALGPQAQAMAGALLGSFAGRS